MTMSVVWPGREGVEVEPRDVPPPGPGELKIRIEASGLCGPTFTDWEAIVTHRVPLARFEEAWEAHREGAGLKVCVYPGDK